jgi:two-component system, response regulator PdtaR
MSMQPCVLIVEDEIFLALELEDAMTELGFHVSGLAPTSDRARSLAQSEAPDLVLMDVCLEGGREGIETARWMRDVCGAEIVFVTGQTDRDTFERIKTRVPGAPVLNKPINHRRLADTVAAVL